MQIGNEDPVCMEGECPIGYDRLPPRALRVLDIRRLLNRLPDSLADRICNEYGVDLDDLKTLAEIEMLQKELHPPSKGQEEWLKSN